MNALRTRPWLAIWALLAFTLIAVGQGVLAPRAAVVAALTAEQSRLSVAAHTARQTRAQRDQARQHKGGAVTVPAEPPLVLADLPALGRHLVEVAARADVRIATMVPVDAGAIEMRTLQLELRTAYPAFLALLRLLAAQEAPVRVHSVRLQRTDRAAAGKAASELDAEIIVEALAWPPGTV